MMWKAQLVVSPASPVYLDRIDGPIYRRFPQAQYADALCGGLVWLSTLEECRKYEDAERGDSGEAVHLYRSDKNEAGGSGYDFINSDEAGKRQIARRVGIDLGPKLAKGIVVAECIATERVTDAWVLCCTDYPGDDLADRFGQHCVRIDRPWRLFENVTANLKFKENGAVTRAQFGRVIYRDREYAGLDAPPGPVGFVKPAHPYAPQREVRFLWTGARGRVLEGQGILSSIAKRLCTRIS